MKKIMTLICLVIMSAYGLVYSQLTFAENGHSKVGGRLTLPLEEIEELEEIETTDDSSSTEEIETTDNSSSTEETETIDNSSSIEETETTNDSSSSEGTETTKETESTEKLGHLNGTNKSDDYASNDTQTNTLPKTGEKQELMYVQLGINLLILNNCPEVG